MFYLLKRIDEKQCTVGDVCMVLADFSGIPAGTKGVIIEIYDEGVMVAWTCYPKDRSERLITVQMIQDKIATGEPFIAVQGWKMDGFSRDELEYLAFETAKHPTKAA